jgi:hypothetical protein
MYLFPFNWLVTLYIVIILTRKIVAKFEHKN